MINRCDLEQSENLTREKIQFSIEKQLAVRICIETNATATVLVYVLCVR